MWRPAGQPLRRLDRLQPSAGGDRAVLDAFIAEVLAASAPGTRVLIQQRWSRRTSRVDGHKWCHGHRRLERAAVKLGCEILWPRAAGNPLKEVRLFGLRRLSAR